MGFESGKRDRHERSVVVVSNEFGHEPVRERVAFVRSMHGDGGHVVTHVVPNHFSHNEPLAIR